MGARCDTATLRYVSTIQARLADWPLLLPPGMRSGGACALAASDTGDDCTIVTNISGEVP